VIPRGRPSGAARPGVAWPRSYDRRGARGHGGRFSAPPARPERLAGRAWPRFGLYVAIGVAVRVAHDPLSALIGAVVRWSPPKTGAVRSVPWKTGDQCGSACWQAISTLRTIPS
jgi:hypothetical protein